MKKTNKVRHSVQGVFVFVLLGLFALMSTMIVLLGAQMYREIVSVSEQNKEERILSAYVRSMVRAGDQQGCVTVTTFAGSPALALAEEIDGDAYVTYLYAHEGFLYEQFCGEEEEFAPEAGSAIAPVQEFSAAIEDRLLTVKMRDDRDGDCLVQVALHGQ